MEECPDGGREGMGPKKEVLAVSTPGELKSTRQLKLTRVEADRIEAAEDVCEALSPSSAASCSPSSADAAGFKWG